jgi:ribosomal protein S18 acetylase RimI-like enzyme
MPADRRSAADRNFIVSFQKLVDLRPDAQLRRFGSVVAFDTRIPVRIFNGLAILEPAEPEQVGAAIGWLSGRAIPHLAWIREEPADAMRPVMTAHGFELVGPPEPVMAIEPPARVPPPPEGVSVREVTDATGLDDHIASAVANGFPEDAARMLYAMPFLADHDVRLFTAYVDGRPAGHSAAIRSGDVSGVYGVGVPPALRGRGIGTAVTWAAVGAGREWGCELVVLQSSELGFGVYRRMGFEVVTYYELRRPMAGGG